MSLINDILNSNNKFYQLTYTGNLTLLLVRPAGLTFSGKVNIVDIPAYVGLVNEINETTDLATDLASALGSPMGFEAVPQRVMTRLTIGAMVFVPLSDKGLENVFSSGIAMTDPIFSIQSGYSLDLFVADSRSVNGQEFTSIYYDFLINAGASEDTDLKDFLNKLFGTFTSNDDQRIIVRAYWGAKLVAGGLQIASHRIIISQAQLLVPYATSLVVGINGEIAGLDDNVYNPMIGVIPESK